MLCVFSAGCFVAAAVRPEKNPDVKAVKMADTSANSPSTRTFISSSEGIERLHMSVLFSAPLVCHDSQGTLTPTPSSDHESEKGTLVRTFREAQCPVHLNFSYATTEKLCSEVSRGCHALHFSGHGHSQGLAFEDGAGGLHLVPHERLRALVGDSVESIRISSQSSHPSSSGSLLRFVFVAASYSEVAGEAFVDEGVPHVVCVKNETELLDSVILCFARAFYLALAVERTVANSFAIGKAAVASNSRLNQQNAHTDADNFVLLPQLEGPHDRRHDVPVFGPGAEALALSRNQLPYHVRTMAHPPIVGAADAARNPKPPKVFIGRRP